MNILQLSSENLYYIPNFKTSSSFIKWLKTSRKRGWNRREEVTLKYLGREQRQRKKTTQRTYNGNQISE